MIIFAPHADDELIGCWTYLRDCKISHVVYFDELTPTRKQELHRVAEHFNFTPHLNLALPDLAALVKNKTVFLPSIRDSHPKHKEVNILGRSLVQPTNRLFYSVDMVGRSLLKDAEHKLANLNMLYPSQADLWVSNAAYWLFESISKLDYRVCRKVPLMISGELVTVTTDINCPFVQANTPEELIDLLLANGATSFNFTYKNLTYSEYP